MLTQEVFNKHFKSSPWSHRDLKVLVACSGGPDSVVLLHLLSKIPDVQLAVVHFNHGLRGERSDSDMHFVKKIGEDLGHGVHIVSEDIAQYAKEHVLSIEEAGSRRRRTTFMELKHNLGFDFIATGQHLDDQLETVLMNLYHGSGIRGLAGTFDFGAGFIRPLLKYSREDILSFASENSIEFQVDESNSDINFLRNKIRAHIIPKLSLENRGDFEATIRRIVLGSSTLNEMLEDLIEDVDIKEFRHDMHNKIALGMGKLSDYFSPIQKVIFDRAYQSISLKPQGLSSTHFQALKSLLGDDAIGKEIQLPGSINVVRDRSHLIFMKKSSLIWIDCLMTAAREVFFPFFRFEFCASIIGRNLSDPSFFWYQHHPDSYRIRPKKRGDKMTIDESGKSASVNQILQSARVAPHLKEYFPVMEYEDEIIWVPGIRTAHRGMIKDLSLNEENEHRHCIRVQFQEGTIE